MARGKDTFGWKFKVSDDTCRFGIPHMLGKASDIPDNTAGKEEELLELFKSLGFRENGKSFTELSSDLRLKGFAGIKKQYQLIDEAIAYGWLENANKRYYLHTKQQQRPIQTKIFKNESDTNDPFSGYDFNDPSLQ